MVKDLIKRFVKVRIYGDINDRDWFLVVCEKMGKSFLLKLYK